MMQSPVIVFDNVSKSYIFYHHLTGGLKNFLFRLPKSIKAIKSSRYEVLRSISFEIYRNEVVGIIGRNGVGKSTTLGIIAGVIRPTSGSVTVKGRVAPLLELGAGFHHELSGRENIMLNGVLLGLSRREVRQKLDRIIAFSELGDFIDQPVRTYSSGMMARLGFSVVAYMDPDILIVDEILAVGDLAFQKKCYERMEKFRENGVTIVFFFFSTREIAARCNRVIWLENCGVKMEGAPDRVIEAYEVQYGGSSVKRIESSCRCI